MEEERSSQAHRGNTRYLTFYLEGETFAFEISGVREIIAMMKITPVPRTPHHIKGVMNLRGNIIPIVDLRTKFGLPEKEPEMYTAIVIMQQGDHQLGFIVDRVEEVAGIAEDRFREAPQFGSSVDTSFIDRVAQIEEQVIFILNLEKVFDLDEIAAVEQMI